MDINNEQLKILLSAIDNGIIDVADTQKKLFMIERNKILKNYNIWRATDGRYKTYIQTEKGRKLVAKRDYLELEDYILSLHGVFTRSSSPSLQNLYDKWLDYKKAHTRCTNYIKRIDIDYRKYYLNEPLSENILTTPIKELKVIDLDFWANNLVKQRGLNKKQYYNATLIIRQVLDYCTLDGVNLLEYNPFEKVKINNSLFVTSQKKKNVEQVYLEEEEQKLLEHIMQNKTITGLAIAFNFQMGLRVGELMSLKWNDIEDNYITIQRTEITVFDENLHKVGVDVDNHTKSECGYRTIYIPKKAMEILQMVKEIEKDETEFIFTHNGKRTTTQAIDSYLRRASKKIGIPFKSSHKIRKTYISKLIDNGVNLDTVRKRVGHSDERTTLHCYLFDRKSENEIRQKLDLV